MPQAMTAIPTPLGVALVVVSDGERLVNAHFRRSLVAARPAPRDPILREAVRQAGAYFRKRLTRFDIPLRLDGTPFQNAVWTFVAQLGAGESDFVRRSRAIGRPPPRAPRGRGGNAYDADRFFHSGASRGGIGRYGARCGRERDPAAAAGVRGNYFGMTMSASAQPRSVRMRARYPSAVFP